MIKRIYGIRDEKAQDFGTFIVENADYIAARNFESTVMTAQARNDGLFFSHPEDFSLWYLGEIDTESGQYIPDDDVVTPLLLVRADEILI